MKEQNISAVSKSELIVGDVVTINDKIAVITKVFDKNQSKKQRCDIQQDGKKYCVFLSDLKIYKG